jgi:hypothetical protein
MKIQPKPHETPLPGESAVNELKSPFCGDLRSKKFFMLDVLATEEGQYLDASNHCWCYQTQQVVGPDGRQVAPQACTPGRSCYVSSLNGNEIA